MPKDDFNLKTIHQDEKNRVLIQRKIGSMVVEKFISLDAYMANPELRISDAYQELDMAFTRKYDLDEIIKVVWDEAQDEQKEMIQGLYDTIHRLQRRRWYHLLGQSLYRLIARI